jgi:hypothetical protein
VLARYGIPTSDAGQGDAGLAEAAGAVKVSRRWLEAFRPHVESRELVERLAMLGARWTASS